MKAKVRAFEPRDAEAVRHICIETDSHFKPEQQPVLLNMYCNYYMEQEPDCCFVLADEQDRAVGYVIASKDWASYVRAFREIYQPRLRKHSMKFALMQRFSMASQRRTDYYPAHLHIDILPEYQGGGGGRALMTALFARLRALGVPGVQLGVSASNTGAIAFYEKIGFETLRSNRFSRTMGYRLDGADGSDSN